LSPRPPLTASSDTTRKIPGSASARLDRIDAALASLAEEERRVTRLGLEVAMARCREQRRYWQFLRSLFSLDENPCPRKEWE
jgi:hypothetical protein